MSFANPDLLWLSLGVPALVAVGVVGYARRRRRVARTLGETDLVSRLGAGDLHRFPAWRLALLSLAACALGLAAAGPRWGMEAVETRSRALDLVLALDVSRSMMARDLPPNRLERQRLLTTRLLRELEGDRVGLVVFAGRAYILAPLTVDHAALQLYVDALDPEIVSQGGSSLASALAQATDLLRGDRQTGGDRAVVLVTDGEALEEEHAVVDAAARAAASGVTVYTVGIGTPAGAPVPDVDPATGRLLGYKRGPDGEVVVSRRNDALLESIARSTGGRFVRADEAGATDRLLADLRGMERTTARGDRRSQPRERFGWFIGFALLMLSLDSVLARWRQRRVPAATFVPQAKLQEVP